VMSSCVTTAAWLEVGSIHSADTIRRAIILPLAVLVRRVHVMSISRAAQA
jgi:isoaspartyl peptidase/L-asparaginase-like protein (Ntn-hydrolase superfamily)